MKTHLTKEEKQKIIEEEILREKIRKSQQEPFITPYDVLIGVGLFIGIVIVMVVSVKISF